MTQLEVRYQGELVGRAVAKASEDRFGFVYDDGWLHGSESFPISANLPLRSKPWPPERAHAYFANLLPEGLARQAVCNRLGISADNDVALLRALGDDTAGAFQFLSPEADDDRRRNRRPITQSELDDWAEGEPTLTHDAERPPRLSLAGARHKISVVRTESGFAIPAWNEPSTHILKFEAPEFPHLTANECLTTRFAANLGIETVQSHLDHRTSSPLLVVDRYDRMDAGESVRRLHQEDFCQILGVSPTRKYEAEGGPELADIATEIRRISSRPAGDILALVRWVIACAVCGNADNHAKNLSMLYAPEGIGLAPAYDIVCTRAYPNLHRAMAFSVGGRRNSDRILREHWERFADAIDVRERLVFRELERLLEDAEDAFERTVEEFRDEFGNSPAIPHVSRAVHKRIRAMRTHL